MKRCMNCMDTYEDTYNICPHCGYVEGSLQEEIYYLTPGTVLNGRYVVGTVCGAGGFGIVYRAWDQNLEKMVAIKEYYPASLVGRAPGSKEVYIYAKRREEEFRTGLDRFLLEARNVAKFGAHPNIVNVYNFFEENGTAYFVMEFMNGVSYKQFIKNNGGMVSEELAVRVTLAVLDALHDIHKAGIIHRDIAPDNIFILENGTIKINDFGAARFAKGDKEEYFTQILKPGFAPTEQYKTMSRQGPYTDFYAVGAMLYRAVTGVMPTESTNRVNGECLAAPKEINPDISDNLNAVILRAMAMQPELRFQTTEEFKDALVGKKSVLNVEKELKKRKKKRRIGIVAAACLLLAGLGIGFLLYDGKRAQTELKAAEIVMWVPVQEENSEIVGRIYDSIVGDFRQDYPQVDISVVPIPEEEYVTRLQAASGTEEMPTIYDSSRLTEAELTDAAEIDRVFEWLNMEEYYGLQEYMLSQGKKKKLPVSFYMPLLYVRGTEEQDISAEELSQTEAYSEESLQKFLNGDSSFLLADSSCYLDINSSMAARYHLQAIPDTVTVTGSFARSYSISNSASVKEKNAVYRLLYYLLSEDAQYTLCIENQEDVNNGIPLNRNSFTVWLAVNMEMKGKAEKVPKLSYKQ